MSNSEHPRPLPCPHCGGSEHLYPSYRFSRLTGRVEEKPHAIDCVQCGYDFTPREGSDVIAMWNRRFDPTDLSVLAKAQDEAGDLRLQNEFVVSILKGAMEELGIADECQIEQSIGEIAAQNEWLKARLSSLQLSPKSQKNIEEWLVECGMPSLSRAKGA